MSCWALVPARPRGAGKSRLACVLSPERRRALVQEMLAHVFDTMRRVPQIEGIAAVGPERGEVGDDVLLLPDEGGGLNPSLTQALRALEARGAKLALIVHADLPLVCEDDLRALLAAARRGGLAIAPDRHGQGTNAMGLALPPALPLRFGEDSFRRHLAEAAQLKLRPEIVRTQGLGFDLDSVEDWQALQRMKRSES